MRSLCTLVLFPVLCLCSLKAGAVTPNATVPDLTKGQSISSARKSLIKHGWRPRVTYLKMNEEDYEHSWSDAGVMFKAGLREVEACTGTGVNPCIFNYQHKSGKCLRIITLGEYNAGHYEPTVDSWSFECPLPENSMLVSIQCIRGTVYPIGVDDVGVLPRGKSNGGI